MLHGAGKGPSDGLGATYKSNMTAAEMRGIYMPDTYSAFRWLSKKFVTSTRRKSKHKKERHSIWSHQFFYVPAHGEQAHEEPCQATKRRVLPNMNRKRKQEMTGGTNSINNFDFFAPEGVTHVGARWLSHSCGPCLGGVYDKCTLGKARHTTQRMFIATKQYTGASESKALMKERISMLCEKLTVGMFVALYQISDSGRGFILVQVAATPRDSIVGELVSGERPRSSKHKVIEVHFGELVPAAANSPSTYKFETGACCTKTMDDCGSAKGCKLRHSHKIFADVVLPPISLQLQQQLTRRHRSRKRQKTSTAAEAPGYWILPPGMEQKIMSTISDDQQVGVTYTTRV